jgi:hypothetical protein
MGRGKDLSDLRNLDAPVLQEVIREGEARLAAQLAIATAADQRAMTWAGFLIAVATAALGGAASLIMSGKHLVFALIALTFSLWMLKAAWIIIDAVRPRKFFLPGNFPENWLRSNWSSHPDGRYDLDEARVEQATGLNNGIHDNAEDAEAYAAALRRSMDQALLALCFSALATFGVFLWVALSASWHSRVVEWL